jgi:hypothetical protein
LLPFVVQKRTAGMSPIKKHENPPGREKQERLDRVLEEGLEETFPGSDAVSVVQPPRSLQDKDEV